MLNDGNRVQFRLSKPRARVLEDLAEAANTTPSILAKRLIEDIIDGDEVDSKKLAEDLLVIRAGMEEMFRRADRSDELSAAIQRVRQRRGLREKREDRQFAGGAS